MRMSEKCRKNNNSDNPLTSCSTDGVNNKKNKYDNNNSDNPLTFCRIDGGKNHSVSRTQTFILR